VEWTTGREAALTLPDTYSPVDTAVVSIVDHAWSDKRYLG
jgi:microcompartment protein CcmK/EutM